jgi:phage gpG-like protein
MTEAITSNAAEVGGQLDELASRVGNPQRFLERARRLLNAQEAQVWATDGGILGAHWAAAAEPDRKVDSRLLVASGALRAALTGNSGSIRGTELTLPDSLPPYGVFHQYGTSKMAARPFLGFSQDFARQLLELYREDVEAAES